MANADDAATVRSFMKISPNANGLPHQTGVAAKMGHASHRITVWASALPKAIHDPRYRMLIQLLASARMGAELSQTQLAKRLKKPQQFVSRYEVGERRLDVIEFVDIAHAIGIDPLDLLRRVS
jgi:ribosome-binding protein aMBF1 (putative translation factor)